MRIVAPARALAARLVGRVVKPLAAWFVVSPLMPLMRFVPTLPAPAAARPWDLALPPVPDMLRTTPGIPRDPVAEEAAFRERPLFDFLKVHRASSLWARRHMWQSNIPSAPRIQRAVIRIRSAAGREPAGARRSSDPAWLTGEVRRRASELGLSAIGVASYDPKYTFAQYQNEWFGGTVIVCVFEQDFERTQRIPAADAARAVQDCYAGLLERAARLAETVQDLGYRARPEDHHGNGIVQHYAVEAGLGQMGLNGQLLTPIAGSRCRISLIHTDAPLVRDAPRDYGVPKVCDACKACVQRCPPGAIPVQREMHRGVLRVQIREDRCFPVASQSQGCAVCTKVCPVQRFGLQPVIEELTRTGRIIGRGTDELEGYDWIDGRHYGPGVRPKLDESVLSPPGWPFDWSRTTPTNEQGETTDPGF